MNKHLRPVKSTTVSVAEAKARFSELLAKAASGEEVRVTRHGRPYAVLGPDQPEKAKLPRVGAFAEVEFWMADDFDELGPEWDEYVR